MNDIDRVMKAHDDLIKSFAANKEKAVKNTVTWKMSQRIDVDVRQPPWMPNFVWKWMWRQVIVTEYDDPFMSVE